MNDASKYGAFDTLYYSRDTVNAKGEKDGTILTFYIKKTK